MEVGVELMMDGLARGSGVMGDSREVVPLVAADGESGSEEVGGDGDAEPESLSLSLPDVPPLPAPLSLTVGRAPPLAAAAAVGGAVPPPFM